MTTIPRRVVALFALCLALLVGWAAPAQAGAGADTLYGSSNETLYGAQNQGIFSPSRTYEARSEERLAAIRGEMERWLVSKGVAP